MELDKTKTVAFSGHRSFDNLPDQFRLIATIQELYDSGCTNFITGLAVGFDLSAALAVSEVMKNAPDIRMIGAVPFPGQELRYKDWQKLWYSEMYEKCTDIVTISEYYHNGAYFQRNDFMVDNSSILVCYYNGNPSGTAYTVNRAKQRGLRIINLFDECK